MPNTSHIHDHLTVAKLAAIAKNDQMLVYLIQMALIQEAQSVKDENVTETIRKVA